MPQTAPSRRWMSSRRNAPAFFGTVESIALNTPTIAEVRAHAWFQDRLPPYLHATPAQWHERKTDRRRLDEECVRRVLALDRVLADAP